MSEREKQKNPNKKSSENQRKVGQSKAHLALDHRARVNAVHLIRSKRDADLAPDTCEGGHTTPSTM
jgi:hypothetical protein